MSDLINVGLVLLLVLGAIAAVYIVVALLPYILGLVAIVLVGTLVIAAIVEYPGGSSKTASASFNATYTSEPAFYQRTAEQTRFHDEAVSYVYQKSGVNLNSLQPALDSAILNVVDGFQRVLGYDYYPTVTSGDDYDGHAAQSAHYCGAALDFRLKDIKDPHLREMVAVAVRENLDDRFFVDHEYPGQDREHLHIQLRKGTYSKVAWR